LRRSCVRDGYDATAIDQNIRDRRVIDVAGEVKYPSAGD
jgi:hypothetical protein